MRGPEAGRQVAAELLTQASGPTMADDAIPFLNGDVAGLAALALRHLGDAHRPAFGALLARLRTVSGPQAVTVTCEALRLAWPDGEPVPEGTRFADLTEPQQRLLRVLAESPDTWGFSGYPVFGNFSLLPSGHGLPNEPGEMRAYVDDAGETAQ